MNAFICHSPNQIIRAIQMKCRMPEFQDPADIFIGAAFNGYADVAGRLKDLGMFSAVYPIDTTGLKHPVGQMAFLRTRYTKCLKANKYTRIISFNIESEVAQVLYFFNRRNKGFSYDCAEDGPNIYTIYEPRRYAPLHPYRLIGLDRPCFHIHTWWSSCPDFIEVPDAFGAVKKKLPTLDAHDDALVQIINAAFDYKPDAALDACDVLIMEESHFTDGLMIGNADFNIYKKIKDTYPQSRFLVKLHPRTSVNRFEKDFPVMRSSHLPWELFVLNRMRQKNRPLLQISIACGTMLSDKLMFGDEGCKLILAPLFQEKIRPMNGVSRVGDELIANYEKVRGTYTKPENFVIAHSEEELFAALDRFLIR